MSEAHYFHATLFKFNDVARDDVLKRFNATVSDVSTRCWYDSGHFELKCRQESGPAADDALSDAIDAYIRQDLADSERQNRAPNVTQLEEGFADEEGDQDESTNADTSAPVAPTQGPDDLSRLPVTLHLINAERISSSIKCLRFFKLHELPAGLLERTLATPQDRRATNAIRAGLTCRIVKPRGQSQRFVFDGAVGTPVPPFSSAEEAAFLGLAAFPVLEGSAVLPEEPPKEWRFKAGHEIGVNQWLSGMGQTELVEPGEQAEMPKETRKLLAAEQSHTIGRVRVPKGALLLSTDSDEENEKPGEETTNTTPSFMDLLHGNGAAVFDSEESASDTASTRSEDDSPARPRAAFRTLLQQQKTENVPPVVAAAVIAGPDFTSRQDTSSLPTPPAQTERELVQGDSRNTQNAQTERSSGESSVPIDDQTAFLSYGRQFAAVDTVGLTANAASQALWELEHGLPTTPPTHRQKTLSIRSMKPTNARPTHKNTGMTIRIRPHSQNVPSQPPALSTAEAISSSEVPAELGTWTNRVVHSRNMPTGKLVDDAAVASRTAASPPPGLHTVPEEASRCLPAVVCGVQPDGRLIPPLVDINDESDAANTTTTRPPPGFTARPLRPINAAVIPGSLLASKDDDDPITERLQLPPPTEQKRYTMRQRAGKKGKGGTLSKAKPKVQLPLPDPVPPPRTRSKETPKPATKQTSTISKQQQQRDRPRKSRSVASDSGNEASSDDSEPDPDTVRTSQGAEKPKTMAVQLTNFVQTARALEPDCNLTIQFGLALLPTSDDVHKDAFPVGSFRSISATLAAFFCPRLSTSPRDAQLILEMVGDEQPLQTQTLYIFRMRLPDGIVPSPLCYLDNVLTYSPPATLHDYEILAGPVSTFLAAHPVDNSGSTLGEAYIHYPHRVWDAMWSVRTVSGPPEDESGVIPALSTLLSTMSTVGEPPSFCATLPRENFGLEKVYAKREYTRRINDGPARLIVSEVQELVLESLTGDSANLKATCSARDAMIDDQRLWWEAKLVSDSDIDVQGLQTVVDTLVTRMDGVGYHNRGPWQRVNEDERRVAVPEEPFW